MFTLVRAALPAMLPAPSAALSYNRQDALRPNLRASVYDAGAYGLMVGVGEAYLPAFALAIGVGEVASGLVTSVPIFLGGLIQLLSLYALPWCGSYKRWIEAGILVQAMAFLPLIYAALAGSISAWVLFAIVSCYWGAGMASGPPGTRGSATWFPGRFDLITSRVERVSSNWQHSAASWREEDCFKRPNSSMPSSTDSPSFSLSPA